MRAAITHFFSPHSHDAAGSIDNALEGSAEGIRVVKLSLLGLGITAQLVVVFFSGSVALLADTIHNFADASTAIPLWLAFSTGRRTANRRNTCGYGRAEDSLRPCAPAHRRLIAPSPAEASAKLEFRVAFHVAEAMANVSHSTAASYTPSRTRPIGGDEWYARGSASWETPITH